MKPFLRSCVIVFLPVFCFVLFSAMFNHVVQAQMRRLGPFTVGVLQGKARKGVEGIYKGVSVMTNREI